MEWCGLDVLDAWARDAVDGRVGCGNGRGVWVVWWEVGVASGRCVAAAGEVGEGAR